MTSIEFVHPIAELDDKIIKHVSQKNIPISVLPSALEHLNYSRQVVNNICMGDKPVYGINTGFGKLANIKISKENLQTLQKNLIISHAVGVGDLLADNIVRLILLLKIQSLLQGYSGVRPILLEYLIKFYNAEMLPCVPSKGSVGASGDLAPLAHLSLPLLGLGECRYKNKIISGQEALQILQLTLLELAPKEGLALINGTQVSTAIALTALMHLEKVFNATLISGVLTTIAAGGHLNAFSAPIQIVRKQAGQIYIAEQLLALASDTQFILSDRVQDPYCIRCQPQVMGACYDQWQFAKQILIQEANAVSDNPLIFPATNEILSGGNFHAEPVAMAADQLALVLAEIGSITERRIAFLVDTNMSKLPAFLIKEAGLNSGFMIAQVTAAALVSENKSLAHPASADSIPTSANQEDHVSMATYAARRLLTMAENTATIAAIELLAACQALDLNNQTHLNSKLKNIYQQVRNIQPYFEQDISLAKAIETIKKLILEGALHD